jgi:hypothetical protein
MPRHSRDGHFSIANELASSEEMLGKKRLYLVVARRRMDAKRVCIVHFVMFVQ